MTKRRTFRDGHYDDDMEIEPQLKYKGTADYKSVYLSVCSGCWSQPSLVCMHSCKFSFFQLEARGSTDLWVGAETWGETTRPRWHMHTGSVFRLISSVDYWSALCWISARLKCVFFVCFFSRRVKEMWRGKERLIHMPTSLWGKHSSTAGKRIAMN